MNRKNYGLSVAAVLAVALVVVPCATATTLDLRSTGASGFIRGGFFEQAGPQPTGTGYIDSFVRLSGNDGDVSGYNTTVNNVFDNMSDDTHNHALLLTDIPVVMLLNESGSLTAYRQFLLDINENGRDPHISLDEVQIFQSSTANQSVTSFSGGVLDLASSNLVYRMDPGHEVLLDYSLNHGSGSGDMFMYIEDSLFSYGQQYVYLYSDFGLTIREDAGFEEWAVIRGQNQGVVPEPSSMVLLGVGLAGLIARRRMRKS